MVEIKTYRITQVKKHGENIRIYRLESATGETLVFKPGQFVNLYLKENGAFSLFRQFSIASQPGLDYLEFCIKIAPDGRFTAPLDKLPVGSEIGLAGPFGHFVYAGQEHCVFVAAGTGIAPMMSMLRHITDNKVNGAFTLLYTNKTRDSILYYDEIKELGKRNPSIKTVFTLTQEPPDDWSGERGRINPDMVKKYVSNLSDSTWYFCGPVEFVKAVKDQVLNNGAKPQNIKIEGWG